MKTPDFASPKAAAAKAPTAAPKPIKVVPNSPKAKAAIVAEIRKAAGKATGELTKADLEKVTRLRLRGYKITNLMKPLAGLTELKVLDLYHNPITDLKPLAGLKKLERLWLDGNQITDLKPLAGLKKLEWLWLHNNKITDVKPLAGLTGLEALVLDNNQITDLKPLAGLKELERLWLDDNPNLTKVEIDKLQKALPKCRIEHNATN